LSDLIISAIVEVNQYRMTKFDYTSQKYMYQKLLYDGHKLAWAPCLVDMGEIRFTVDLDEGKTSADGPSRNSYSTQFFIVLRATAQVQISAIRGYLILDRKVQFNTSVQVALNFIIYGTFASSVAIAAHGGN
ncbi:hypothetical protein E4U15_006853, partial [Claviceps sp. LM218 group G6]